MNRTGPQAPFSSAAEHRAHIQRQNEQLDLIRKQNILLDVQRRLQTPRSMGIHPASATMEMLRVQSDERQRRVEMGVAGTLDPSSVGLGILPSQAATFPAQQNQTAAQLQCPPGPQYQTADQLHHPSAQNHQTVAQFQYPHYSVNPLQLQQQKWK